MPTNKQINKPIDRIVGANLRKIRIQRGFSQEKLGSALGISFQQLQKYENASNRISASAAVSLCRELKCSIDDLFKGTMDGAEVVASGPIFSSFAVKTMTAFEKLPDSQRSVVSKLITVLANEA